MDWTPHVFFVVAGLLAAVAQDRYYDELVRRGDIVSSDESIVQHIRDRPDRLIDIVARETPRRLRALFRPQQATKAERLRILALLAVAATVACFVWTILNLAPI